jgi:hypothetical protein
VEGQAYLGFDVHLLFRVCAAGHGGQILLSQATRDLVGDEPDLRDLGPHLLAGAPRPVRLYQLLVPGLRTEFPPLRAERTEGQRLAGARRTQELTLADAAWRVQKMLPDAAEATRARLAALGAALFTADRALAGSEAFIARVDRKRMAHRLANERQVGGLRSPQARKRLELLERQTECVELLLERRQTLLGLMRDLPDRLAGLQTGAEIESLHDRAGAATEQLDQALTQAARALDPTCYTRKRTGHRGIYSSGSRYIVPYIDEIGRERQREFDTVTQAKDFRKALRIAEKAKPHDFPWHGNFRFPEQYPHGGQGS